MRRAVVRSRRQLAALASALAVVAIAAPDGTRAEHSASAAVYVRDDTDRTTVISPRVRLRAQALENTHVDLAYAADVWTSASVDIVASASEAVTEQRDEINVGLDQVIGDVTLAGGYRYSIEPDYESHGGALSLAWNLADNAATLALSVGGSADTVGRVGDDAFAEDVDTFVTGLSFTQVIDTDTLVQVLYDVTIVRGYQASAYRYVALGGDGQCQRLAPFCLPEQNPRERLRHALALRLRRALGQRWSLGAGYRGYIDDWGILSHTARADLTWAPDASSAIALTYRFYTQSAADHYKPFYFDSDRFDAYFTRDKELSPLSSHRVGLEIDRVWKLSGGDSGLVTGVEVAPTFYRYHDYPLLDQVTAIEVTAVAGMEFQ